jgi:hypothetical protein
MRPSPAIFVSKRLQKVVAALILLAAVQLVVASGSPGGPAHMPLRVAIQR